MAKINKDKIVLITKFRSLKEKVDKDEVVRKLLIDKGFKQTSKTSYIRGLDKVISCFFPCRMGIHIRLANENVIDIPFNVPLDKVLSILKRKL